ncbi:MAG: hypothetical protein EOP48_10850 [Sphingobacteriales bacterium]|nr:MAG: hypothetical protein EOP48_10850 [Sphingobacteriales bacterium]
MTFDQATKIIEAVPIKVQYFISLYRNLNQLCKRNPGLENLLVRNLLNNLGFKSKVRAIGNNDIRVDLVAQKDDKVLLAEIDLGNDTLDLPRAILDDVAVLHSRYGIKKDSLLPIIVMSTFANKRSDFYEVLADIEKITTIKIRTLSVQFLIMMSLFRRQLDLKDVTNKFFVNHKNPSIRTDAIACFEQLEQIDPFINKSYYSASK